ncbi:MAG: site-2 protease family protein [Firmicutes bacterium]|nr:site-2 protease family protein [Bacillota bacterium]
MPVWAEESWRPLSQEDPHWRWLTRSLPLSMSLPGSWEIRGQLAESEYLFGSLSAEDRDRIQHIFIDRGPKDSRPIVLSIGDAEIKYIPPPTHSLGGRFSLRRIWTVVLGVLVKFKLVLFFGSVVLTLLVYGIAFGWAFGAGLVALIAVHESGHVVANRIKGIPASLPVFIPFLGAFIRLKKYPQNAGDEAFIGIMGPLFGLGATLVALLIATLTHDSIFYAIAEMGFLLHVFNLMPVLPLDGGRTVGFWQWKAWIPGMVGVLMVLFYNPLDNRLTFDPLTIFIVAIIVVSMIREPKQHRPEYRVIPSKSQWLFTIIWGLALLVSIAGYWGVGHLHSFA